MPNTKIVLPFATQNGNAYLPTTGITLEIPHGTQVKATLSKDGTFTIVFDNVVSPSENGKVMVPNNHIDTAIAKPAKVKGKPI